MDRVNFYVVRRSALGWGVGFGDATEDRPFLTRENALDAAREAAKMRWEMSGQETGVMICDVAGAMTSDMYFGTAGNS